MYQQIKNYLQETQGELRRVTWPTRAQTVKYTLLVIGISVAVALFLGALDYVFNYILGRYIL